MGRRGGALGAVVRRASRRPALGVSSLDAVACRLLVNLAGWAPLLPGAAELAYLDVDDTLMRV